MDNKEIIDCIKTKIDHLDVAKKLLSNIGVIELSGYDDAIAQCQEEIRQLS